MNSDHSESSNFGNITLLNLQLMITGPKVNLGKDTSTLQLIKEIVNARQRRLFLDGNSIELTVVDAQPKRTIFLPHEEDRCSPG